MFMASTPGPGLRAQALGQGVTSLMERPRFLGALHRQGGWSLGDRQDWVSQGGERVEQKSHLKPEEKVSIRFVCK